ncbi:MAG: type II toxin-antitoxin system VapC family toxin [Pseudomonadota bacterium]
MSFLIDTNVVSELTKVPPNEGVVRWLKTVPRSEAWISVAVIAEIRSGIEFNAVNRHGVDLDAWLVQSLLPQFSGRILEVDERIAHHWGRFDRQLRRLSVKEPTIDALLAATAKVHGLIVSTRNVKHFEPLGIPVFDPYTATDRA